MKAHTDANLLTFKPITSKIVCQLQLSLSVVISCKGMYNRDSEMSRQTRPPTVTVF